MMFRQTKNMSCSVAHITASKSITLITQTFERRCQLTVARLASVIEWPVSQLSRLPLERSLTIRGRRPSLGLLGRLL